jgi:hypothetical protein
MENFSQDGPSLAEIRTKHLLSTNLQGYNYTNLLDETYALPIHKCIKLIHNAEGLCRPCLCSVSYPKLFNEFRLN